MKLPKWMTKVTPFSRAMAMFILVLFPILGFVIGAQYQKLVDIAQAPPVLRQISK